MGQKLLDSGTTTKAVRRAVQDITKIKLSIKNRLGLYHQTGCCTKSILEAILAMNLRFVAIYVSEVAEKDG